MRAMYSPTIHSEIKITPLKNVSVHIIDVHPGVKLFHLFAYDKIEYIKIMIEIITEIIPSFPTIFNGLFEKLIIPFICV